MDGGVPIALVPLLIVELLVVVVGRMDGEVIGHPGRQLQLLVDLVQQQIVLLTHHAVAVRAVLSEHLEPCIKSESREIPPQREDRKGGTSANAAGVICTPGSELRPGEMSVMRAHLGHLLLVALDTPVGTDVITVDEAALFLLRLRVCETRREGAQNKLPGDIHLY